MPSFFSFFPPLFSSYIPQKKPLVLFFKGGLDKSSPYIKRMKKRWNFKITICKITKMFAGFSETLST
jgi:hypothetical protein